MDEISKKYSLLKNYNVPRETLLEFEKFVEMLTEINKNINIISKKTSINEVIRERHIIDSAQAIDFIDLNSKTITDIGTGGGMPGIVVSIMIKKLKKSLKTKLYEKSHHKSAFLRKVSREMQLNTEVIQENIFEQQNLESGTIMARAFKPLPVILELIHKNFVSYKNVILFMGKNGDKILEEVQKNWNFDFEKKKVLQVKNHFY